MRDDYLFVNSAMLSVLEHQKALVKLNMHELASDYLLFDQLTEIYVGLRPKKKN